MDPITGNPAFVIFAAFVPLLVAFVKQEKFTSQVNSLIALGCYFVVGILGALTTNGPFTLTNVVSLITVVTLVGTAAYNLFWSQVGGDDSVDQRITQATSVFR